VHDARNTFRGPILVGNTVREGVVLTPNQVPWRRLFAELDCTGETMSAEPVTAPEEADAIVAACWRYGTFFHVLTFGGC